jgi:hypothetical protein
MGLRPPPDFAGLLARLTGDVDVTLGVGPPELPRVPAERERLREEMDA